MFRSCVNSAAPATSAGAFPLTKRRYWTDETTEPKRSAATRGPAISGVRTSRAAMAKIENKGKRPPELAKNLIERPEQPKAFH
jgi:hypothetical protein